MSDSAKRVHKRLLQLTEQAAALLEQYAAIEVSSFGVLVALFNVFERLVALEPASIGALHAAERFGPLVCFDGLTEGVVDSIRQDAQRLHSRVVLYLETMQSACDKLQFINCSAQDALRQSGGASTLLLLSSHTVSEPHSALDDLRCGRYFAQG